MTPTNTATAAGAAALVTPVLTYFLTLVQLAPPTEVISCLVVMLIAGAHWASDRFAKPVQ
jgi:hypothetical protein